MFKIRALLLFVVLVIPALGIPAEGTAGEIDRRSVFGDLINQLIETFRALIPETINIPNQNITLVDNEYILAALSLFNNNIQGLKYFTVNVEYRGSIIPIPYAFSGDLENTNLHLEYDSLVQFVNNSNSFLIEEDGSVDVAITGIRSYGNVNAALVPLSLAVSNLELTVSDFRINIKGLVSPGFSELLSRALTAVVAPLFNNLTPRFAVYLEQIINEAIAAALAIGREQVAMNNMESYTEEEYAAEVLKIAFASLSNEVNLLVQKNP